MKLAVIILSFIFLTACNNFPKTDPEQSTVKNPFNYCSALGFSDKSEQYQQCVTNSVDKICISRGLVPGTDAFTQCDSELRKATFVRQQLQIRGF